MEPESVKRIYAKLSNVYEPLFKRFFYPRIKHAIAYMGIEPGDRVLDVGVGTGLSLSLFPRHCEVIGIDISRQMLKKAREKIRREGLDHITLMEMDAQNLEFDDDTFDKVFISHVVSVVPSPARVMSEVRRVCRNGGRVVIVNHFKSKNKMVEKFEKIVDPLCRRIGWRSDMCLDQFLRESGLRVEQRYKLRKLDLWHLIFAVNEKLTGEPHIDMDGGGMGKAAFNKVGAS
ncbi:MAG TPA: methyltransferase domain-containing protein [Deltaproteobacteria bacterium]|nr:methyltransferase domain-containing protein [Deltaproteobacteria bacterium]